MQAQAVGMALQWADEAGAASISSAGVPAQRESSAPPPDEIVELRGHQVLVTRGAMVCTMCGSYQASFQAANCNLDEDCKGPSKDMKARYRQRYNIKAIRSGKHPT